MHVLNKHLYLFIFIYSFNLYLFYIFYYSYIFYLYYFIYIYLYLFLSIFYLYIFENLRVNSSFSPFYICNSFLIPGSPILTWSFDHLPVLVPYLHSCTDVLPCSLKLWPMLGCSPWLYWSHLYSLHLQYAQYSNLFKYKGRNMLITLNIHDLHFISQCFKKSWFK